MPKSKKRKTDVVQECFEFVGGDEVVCAKPVSKKNVRSFFTDAENGMRQILNGMDAFKPKNADEKKSIIRIQELALDLYHACAAIQ